MSKEISVSVIIPAYNSEKYLGACLRSVLEQNFRGFEVIVVDNNSTDRTKEIIFEFAKKHKNLKYIFKPQIGRGAARNTGEKQAKGKAILMTDSDCVVPNGWIKAMASPILAGEALAVQGGEIGLGKDFWSRQADLRTAERFEAFEKGERLVTVDTKNFAISQAVLEKVGFTDKRYEYANDTDVTIRLMKREIVLVLKKEIRVEHAHRDSLGEVMRKQFWGGFWCRKITEDQFFFLRQTNFLRETDQLRRPFGESLKRLKSTILKRGLGYLFFDLIETLAWRLGLFYSKHKLVRLVSGGGDELAEEGITALIPIRNRYDYRVRNCLKSLRSQVYNQSLLQIVIVDYGSENRHRETFEKLCVDFDAKGIWTGRTGEVWNKSKCLNMGLKEIKTKYFIVADTDIIFEKNYLRTCGQIADGFGGRVGLYPKIFDCPKGITNWQTEVVRDFDWFFKKSTYRGDLYRNDFPYGVGILFAPTKIVKEIGGYDEIFESWGSEDIDLVNRLASFGLEVQSISGVSRAIHQWHPKNEGLLKNFALSRRIRLNRQYCENNFSIVRNGSLTPKEFPKNLPGTFWGITCFFNPARYKNKYDNYRIFREVSRKQGLKLVVVELIFGDDSFEIEDADAEIVVRIRGGRDNILWQKEALLNVALKHLPENCDKVAWVDCDVIFENDNWIKETSKLLEVYKIVQPFENSIRMGPGITNPQEYRNNLSANDPIDQGLSFAAAWQIHRQAMISGEFFKYAPGYACAARRETIEQIGFYDRAILGSADSVMIRAFCGWRHFTNLMGLSRGLIKRQDLWSLRAFEEVQNSLFFSSGEVFHLWHGTISDRRYVARDSILRLKNFDPNRDVFINQNGILEWASDDEELKTGLAEYFLIRNEEGEARKELKVTARFYALSQNERRPGVGVSPEVEFRRYRARIKMHWFRFSLRRYIYGDLVENYHRFLGLVGQRLRTSNQNLYIFLKRYFPDR